MRETIQRAINDRPEEKNFHRFRKNAIINDPSQTDLKNSDGLLNRRWSLQVSSGLFSLISRGGEND